MTSQFNFGSTAPALTTTTTNAFAFGTALSTSGQSATLPTLPSLPSMTTSNAFAFNTNPLQSSGLVSNPSLTLTLTTASTAVTQPSTQQSNAFHGLGGTQSTSTESGSEPTLNANKSTKELTFIPPEMSPLVEALKQFVKDQKVIREENSQQRFSIQPILEVGSEIEDNLRVVLHKIEVDIQRNSKAIEGLKRDTNKLLSSAEMAYRISRVDLLQTPSSYTIAQNNYINASTHQYFLENMDNFEHQMKNYSKQIQDLRTHIENMNKPYVCEELMQIMRKQHEVLISLAAKVYAIHEYINQLKLKTQTNYSSKIVDKKSESSTTLTASPNRQSFVGPNPFGLTGDESTGSFATQLYSTPAISAQSVGAGTPSMFSSITSNVNPMPTTPSSFHFPPPTTTTGASHSRAKRWTTS